MSAAPGTAGGGREDERRLVLAAALATALIPLNSTMIALAIPAVVDDLDVGLAASSWLVTGYLIAMAALQPLGGKVGDRLGRRTVLLAGLLLFGAASAGAGAAPTFPVLIAFRLLQALAGALIFPNAVALLREGLPAERRASGFGVIGAAVGLAAAAGLPLGGLAVGLLDWRAIFLLNVPVVAAALVLTRGLAVTARSRTVSGRFDVAGAMLLTAALAGGAAVLSVGDELGAGAVVAGAALVGMLAILFVRVERRHPDPVLQPRFFTRPAFSAATAAIALGNLALYAALLAVPVLMTSERGWSAEGIGAVMSAFALAMVVASPVGGRMADRLGRRAVAAWGGVLLGIGLLPLALAGANVPVGLLVLFLAVGGAGVGLANPALQAAAVEALDERDAGIAAGVFSSSRYLGGITAAGLLALLGGGSDLEAGLKLLFGIAVAAGVLSALLAAGLPARGRSLEPAAGAAGRG